MANDGRGGEVAVVNLRHQVVVDVRLPRHRLRVKNSQSSVCDDQVSRGHPGGLAICGQTDGAIAELRADSLEMKDLPLVESQKVSRMVSLEMKAWPLVGSLTVGCRVTSGQLGDEDLASCGKFGSLMAGSHADNLEMKVCPLVGCMIV
ncbi:50S ribosomal protein L2 [Striga asiatica]|uniref:50S ribosomal protein L2 n=1 Tax=Striga asiatica TaxID=4170 RepID=A0A5A7PMG6_STRAF|nr:50S ribosomal protein L2 [Striga asiatica]